MVQVSVFVHGCWGQSCEKAFRAVRSMTSTFSTIINFGMLGLLRRLHRLHIQFCLEAQTELTGIRYPRVEAHQKKMGTVQLGIFLRSSV